jgi:hypothetical protein
MILASSDSEHFVWQPLECFETWRIDSTLPPTVAREKRCSQKSHGHPMAWPGLILTGP